MSAMLRSRPLERTISRICYDASAAVVAAAAGANLQAVASKKGSLRRRALYLTVTSFNRRRRCVARAAGLSHVAVVLACRQVEDERDDPEIDAEILALEAELSA